MKDIERKLENYCLENNIKLTNEQKEAIKKVGESVIKFLERFIKEVIKPTWELLKRQLDTIDWNKYKRYLKYKKRVENRNKLYIKHKATYGK